VSRSKWAQRMGSAPLDWLFIRIPQVSTGKGMHEAVLAPLWANSCVLQPHGFIGAPGVFNLA
jgi:hypothetical protein